MLQQIIKIVREAGDLIRDVRPSKEDTTEKNGASDLVTKYDVAVQDFLKTHLLALTPDAAFLGEEGDHDAQIDAQWVYIVDPIDGTTNFVRDMRYSNISVALACDGQVVYAVVYNPFTDELYAAERGRGATLNGEKIHVSGNDIQRSIFLCGSTIYDRALTDLHYEMMRKLYDTCLDFRRLGSAAQDICKIAQGQFEVFFECRLRPWDFAAASLILEEAGGKITRLDGSPLDVLRTGSIWATNGITHEFYREFPDTKPYHLS